MHQDLEKLTDRELDAIFAKEVAGWTRIMDCGCSEGRQQGLPPNEYDSRHHVPKFSTSMDALTPWLEAIKQDDTFLFSAKPNCDGWLLELMSMTHFASSSGPLPRALCEALVLWKRTQKG